MIDAPNECIGCWADQEGFHFSIRCPIHGPGAVAESGELSFGAALAYLKQGKRTARRGWNGKGMWLVLVHPMLVGFPERTAGYDLNIGPHSPKELSEVTPLPWIGMKTADNKFVPWLASQTDILYEDWEVVE